MVIRRENKDHYPERDEVTPVVARPSIFWKNPGITAISRRENIIQPSSS